MDTSKDFTALIKKYICNESQPLPCTNENADWQELFLLASIHKITPWIYSAAAGEPGFEKLPDNRKNYFRAAALSAVMMQTDKYIRFFKIYEKLTESGICAVVLKGYVCDILYPCRDHRATGDCDLYVKKEDFEKCRRIFEAEGLMLSHGDDCEKTFSDQSGVLRIELHTSLYSNSLLRDVAQPWFEICDDNLIKAEADGTEFFTFEPTVNLLYLVLHALKHFSKGGVGVRQLCDISLFVQKYHDSIDFDFLGKRLDKVRAFTFFLAVIEASQKHLGIIQQGTPAELLKAGSVDGDELFEDCINAGIYGQSSDERVHSSQMTNKAVEKNRSGTSLFASLFPPSGYMKNKYFFLVKYPFLLPFAYIMRIVGYAFGMIGKKKLSSASESISIAEKRIAMMKKYKMIDG